MLILHAVTLFLAATLLLALEPMFARMVLPRLGGSPAVWNTAMVFYQAALLAGYGYAHALGRAPARVRPIHLVLLAGALVLLPLHIAASRVPPPGASPVSWLLLVMATTVGAPFILVATTGPLIQRWFAASGHAHARDPYFLYGASNLGSMIGLLAYPFVIEPFSTLSGQSRTWAAGYVALIALVAVCAWTSRRGDAPGPAAPADPPEPAPTRGRMLRWIALAFAPSALMLGVTTHLSMDIVAMPLLWVIPLAIYLLTFIVTFSRRSLVPMPVLTRLLCALVLGTMIITLGSATEPLPFIMGIHLATLFVAGLVCHGQLAADRPGVTHLTGFYLCLATGGALGGVFCALVAPLVFRSVAEYPIALVIACVLAPAADRDRPGTLLRDALTALVCTAVAGAAFFAVRAAGHPWARAEMLIFTSALCFPLYALRARPARVGLAVGGLILITPLATGSGGDTLHAERSFFGIHRVQIIHGAAGDMHRLVHGTTVHGLEWTDPARRGEPLGYYHRLGPAGEIFGDLGARARTIGVAGLGAGGLSAYARPGQDWTYFEIDPAVARIASDTAYFSYLTGAAAPTRIRLGDARLSIVADTTRFDLLTLDAYSSDAIPVHLLTREAFRVYLDRLAPHGVLALHLSNRYFDLEPVVARLAEDAGLACRVRLDPATSDAERALGRVGSCWAVVTRQTSDAAALDRDPRWRPPHRRRSAPLWTDDYSSLVSVLR
ncbi:MAG: fused MFS/spermidine synthase [Candidatus Eisenbacteria bacterium]|nr:fused MFS/spermidine synthase [Candidatus Eisenbacteria bacterium]